MTTAHCDGLIGLPETHLVERFGPATTRRVGRDEVWLVFTADRLSLRVRCAGAEAPHVASWSARFDRGFRRLSDATRALGLWPAAAPEEDASTVVEPLIRRALRCRDSQRLYSLTATVQGGLITRISVFDEPPDWL